MKIGATREFVKMEHRPKVEGRESMQAEWQAISGLYKNDRAKMLSSAAVRVGPEKVLVYCFSVANREDAVLAAWWCLNPKGEDRSVADADEVSEVADGFWLHADTHTPTIVMFSDPAVQQELWRTVRRMEYEAAQAQAPTEQ